MGEIEENWQSAKFYCSKIKLIYSTSKWQTLSLLGLGAIHDCHYFNLLAPCQWGSSLTLTRQKLL